MNSVTVLEDDFNAPQDVPIHKGKEKTILESAMSSAQRRKLADISNLQDHSKQMKREETNQQHNVLLSSKEYVEKLQKENMTLMKALAHRNKMLEQSGVECQKLRINLRNMQEKNLQLAQANSQMLAELNTNKDRLKILQHELGCKNAILKVRKVQTEEQAIPCTHRALNDKVPANVSDGDCTKKKRTSRIKPSGSSKVMPIQVKENANNRRKVSEDIDATVISEETCQTEDDIEKGVVSRRANQMVDNIVNKKFTLDAANPEKDIARKRQGLRRKSTRFDVQETEQTEKLLEMDDATETKEPARLSLRRRSTRLRPEEVEPCKSFHERDEVRETTKKRRFSSRQEQSAKFDFPEPEVTEPLNDDDPRFDFPEVTETLNADNAGSLGSRDSVETRSEAIKPSESRHDTEGTNGKRRVSMRRQSTKAKSQTASETNEAIKDTSLSNNIVQECDLIASSISEKDQEESEAKKKTKAEETEEGMMRRTSVAGRPSRHAAEKVQSYKEVSLRVKMRRS